MLLANSDRLVTNLISVDFRYFCQSCFLYLWVKSLQTLVACIVINEDFSLNIISPKRVLLIQNLILSYIKIFHECLGMKLVDSGKIPERLKDPLEDSISFDQDTNFRLHGPGHALTFIFGRKCWDFKYLNKKSFTWNNFARSSPHIRNWGHYVCRKINIQEKRKWINDCKIKTKIRRC